MFAWKIFRKNHPRKLSAEILEEKVVRENSRAGRATFKYYRIYARAPSSTHTYTHARTHTCAYTQTHTRTHTRTRAHTYTYKDLRRFMFPNTDNVHRRSTISAGPPKLRSCISYNYKDMSSGNDIGLRYAGTTFLFYICICINAPSFSVLEF